jgi:AcrR family transcriptional regulator
MNTEDTIIFECTKLIAAEGLQAFSLRKLAAIVGIKAPSIYQHFASKEALLDSARQAAMRQLGKTMLEHDLGSNPRERLISAGLAYLLFAQEQPSLFALLFLHTPSARKGLEQVPSGDSPYAFLLARVEDFLGDTQNAETLAFGVWSLVHGVALLRHTHLKDFSAPLVDGARQNLEALLDGWRSM